MVVVPVRTYRGRAMLPRAPFNVDLLEWFAEDERSVCASCGERATVQLTEAVASFCLACAAVSIEGVRVDADFALPV